MPSISLSTASAVTGLTRRTLWRYIHDGRLRPLGEASQGNKTQLELAEVVALCDDPLEEEDEALVLAADAGKTEAQCELGIWMLELERPSIARDWFAKAARAGYADAMCYLGRDLLLGDGGVCDQDEGMRWLHQADAMRFPLAMALVEALHQPSGREAREANDEHALLALIEKVERKVLLEALEATKNPTTV